MSVGLVVGTARHELGTGPFVHSFFSIISAHCEPEGWGSRFPRLMHGLYQGRLEHAQAAPALAELREARVILGGLPPSQVV